MTVVDALVLGVLALGLALGLVRGFIPQVSGLIGLIGGLILAARYHVVLRETALDPNFPRFDHNGAIAFIFIVVFTVLIAAVIGWLVHKAVNKLQLGTYDRLLGAVFGVLKAGLIVAGILLGLIYFADGKGQLVSKIGDSKTAPMVWKAMDWVAVRLPDKVRPDVEEFLLDNRPPQLQPDE